MNCATIETNRRQIVPLVEFLENAPPDVYHLFTTNFLSVRDECNISSTCKNARERFFMLALLSSDKWAAVDNTDCKIGGGFLFLSLSNLTNYIKPRDKVSPSNRFIIDEKSRKPRYFSDSFLFQSGVTTTGAKRKVLNGTVKIDMAAEEEKFWREEIQNISDAQELTRNQRLALADSNVVEFIIDQLVSIENAKNLTMHQRRNLSYEEIKHFVYAGLLVFEEAINLTDDQVKVLCFKLVIAEINAGLDIRLAMWLDKNVLECLQHDQNNKIFNKYELTLEKISKFSPDAVCFFFKNEWFRRIVDEGRIRLSKALMLNRDQLTVLHEPRIQTIIIKDPGILERVIQSDVLIWLFNSAGSHARRNFLDFLDRYMNIDDVLNSNLKAAAFVFNNCTEFFYPDSNLYRAENVQLVLSLSQDQILALQIPIMDEAINSEYLKLEDVPGLSLDQLNKIAKEYIEQIDNLPWHLKLVNNIGFSVLQRVDK
jgi:hypothetical protein